MKQTLKSTIYDHFSLTPTEQQGKTIVNLVNFTLDEARFPTFILSGYAGTGKTTLVGAYIQAMTELKLKTFLMAPTGRAAKVLSSRAKKQVLTIHKKIYRKQTQAGGIIQLVVSPNLHKHTVFIVDEASMIGLDNPNSESIYGSLLAFLYFLISLMHLLIHLLTSSSNISLLSLRILR